MDMAIWDDWGNPLDDEAEAIDLERRPHHCNTPYGPTCWCEQRNSTGDDMTRRYIRPNEAQEVDPREAKLPVWAQAILNAARRGQIDAEERLAQHLQTIERTQVSWNDIGHYNNPVYLPNTAQVNFDFGGNGELYDTVQVRWNGRHLAINGGRSLVIQPTASNWVDVRLAN